MSLHTPILGPFPSLTWQAGRQLAFNIQTAQPVTPEGLHVVVDAVKIRVQLSGTVAVANLVGKDQYRAAAQVEFRNAAGVPWYTLPGYHVLNQIYVDSNEFVMDEPAALTAGAARVVDVTYRIPLKMPSPDAWMRPSDNGVPLAYLLNGGNEILFTCNSEAGFTPTGSTSTYTGVTGTMDLELEYHLEVNPEIHMQVEWFVAPIDNQLIFNTPPLTGGLKYLFLYKDATNGGAVNTTITTVTQEIFGYRNTPRASIKDKYRYTRRLDAQDPVLSDQLFPLVYPATGREAKWTELRKFVQAKVPWNLTGTHTGFELLICQVAPQNEKAQAIQAMIQNINRGTKMASGAKTRTSGADWTDLDRRALAKKAL